MTKTRIIVSGLLLSVLIFSGIVTAKGEMEDTSEPTDIFQRIVAADDQIGYVGKRLSISWTPVGCFAQEEKVVHQPPDTHFVNMLMPRQGNRSSADETTALLAKPDRREPGRRNRERGQRNAEGEMNPTHILHGPILGSQSQRFIEHLSGSNLDCLLENYDVRFFTNRQDTIAGYDTHMLTMTPRFRDRPTRHVWIERNRGVILRTEEIDSSGNLRFMSVYTAMDFDSDRIKHAVTRLPDPTPSQKESKREQTVSLSEAQDALKNQLVLPPDLPKGFTLQEVTLVKFPLLMRLRSGATAHLRYSDGLMGISLFQSTASPIHKRLSPKGEKRRGVQVKRIGRTPVHILQQRHISILLWSQGKMGLTLIGELNRAEMLKIAESMIRGETEERM